MPTHDTRVRRPAHGGPSALIGGLTLLMLLAAPASAKRGDGPIVFESTQGGQRDIWVMGADGSNPVNLTNDKVEDLFPAWSPDGRRIVWTRGGRGPEGELWVMNADGSGKYQVTFNAFSDNNATWAPDGQRIAFRSFRGDNRDIYVIRDDGTGEQRLTDDPGSDFAPDWSPDGTRIAFTSTRNGHSAVYSMNADGSDVRKLTEDAQEAGLPGWSPDGQRIVYADALCATCSESDLFSMNPDGGDVTQLTDTPDNELAKTWSRTGARVAMDFSTVSPSGTHYAKGDIVVLDLASGVTSNLTATPGISEEHPDWSPAGVPAEPQAGPQAGGGETPAPGREASASGRTLEVRVSPNPVRGLARITYALPISGHVRLRVFDVSGREVARPVDEWQAAGAHAASLAKRSPSQFQLYRLEWPGGVASGKIAWLP